MPIKVPKKLIEVALPLDDINAAATREKSIRHGHPSTLHLWWARRPLAAARAVLFAQMVNDPAGVMAGDKRTKVFKEAVSAERERLFQIIRELVLWENTNNKTVLIKARAEIKNSWRTICELNRDHPQAAELFNPEQLPAFHDPFAGGGTIPLEAQRLGLESYASDLNPVAVMINKAMIEIPPKFAGRAPVGPEIPSPIRKREKGKGALLNEWQGASGLAEDIRRYANALNDLVYQQLEPIYPEIELDKCYGGGKAKVITWLWARTVASPSPVANQKHVPLTSSYWLCKKKGKEAWIKPIVNGNTYTFEVQRCVPDDVDAMKTGTKTSRGANFSCLLTGSPISAEYVKAEGKAGRLGWKLMAIVAEGRKGRAYISPLDEHELIAMKVKPNWQPNFPLPTHPQYMSVVNYGPTNWSDLFMPRQTHVLATFSETLQTLHQNIVKDALEGGYSDGPENLETGGIGATAYADTITFYLGIGISRLANRQSTNSIWHTSRETVEQAMSLS